MLAGATLGLAVGVHSLPFYTSGLFMKALQAEFGWTRAQVSLGPTVLIAALGLASPAVGVAADRWGERALIAPCLVILALFFAGLSRLGPNIGFYYLAVVAMAVIASGSATPTFTRVINASFDKARGTALGIGLVGTGLASTFVPPLLSRVIADHGWRAGYLALAGVVVAATPIIVLLLDRGPRAQARPEAGEGAPLGEALADPIFWSLAAAFFLVALASPGLVVHFVPLLTDQGLTPAAAAGLASAIGLCIIFGRLSTGLMIDRIFAPKVAAGLMTLSAVGFLVLALGGARMALVGALAVGLSFGAEVDLIGYLGSRYFGLKAYGKIYGLLYAACLAGTALSPWAYGWVVDHTGSYRPMLFAAAALLALSAVVFATMRPFLHRAYGRAFA
ncbi:MAG TPA: MFS transporter [Phenylobacterium sp.]|nr:MFS transporter [Phenylobacterium sp.]